jgi:phosphoglycerate kinase
VEGLVAKMKLGDVMLLENLRFHAGEEQNDDAFSKSLAALGDVYINDAFGAAHRAHASTVGITKFVKTAVAGFLLKKEIEYLEGAVENPVRPFVAILGGAKVSGKIGVIENLGKRVDKVIIGGGMAFTFLKAKGLEIGNSLVENDMLDFAKGIEEHAFSRGVKFYLPVDCVVAASRELGAESKIVPVQEIPKGWFALDIGPASVKLFTEALQNAKTILWNGPMGVFEIDAYARGTLSIAHAIADAYALTIVGGGDRPSGSTRIVTSCIDHPFRSEIRCGNPSLSATGRCTRRPQRPLSLYKRYRNNSRARSPGQTLYSPRRLRHSNQSGLPWDPLPG